MTKTEKNDKLYRHKKKKNTKTYEKIINFKENRIQNMNKNFNCISVILK